MLHSNYFSKNLFQSLQVELAEAVDVEVRVTTIGPSFPEVWLQPFTHPTHSKFSRLEARYFLIFVKLKFKTKN